MPTQDSRQQSDSAGFRRGQHVTVRDLDDILATLDADGKLEGMPFMPEMTPLCRQLHVFAARRKPAWKASAFGA